MLRQVLLIAGMAAGIVTAVPGAEAAKKVFWDGVTQSFREFETDPALFKSGQTGRSYTPIRREDIAYRGPYGPKTLIVDTSERRLYYVYAEGKALKYGIGVGREGFQWAGTNRISRKAEWPGWTPPPQMRKRQPGLPVHMKGGPNNPLGARALYIGSTYFRIHGSNEPWTIGHAVSSGCFRMTNEDVIDLYDRVAVGTKVVVLR